MSDTLISDFFLALQNQVWQQDYAQAEQERAKREELARKHGMSEANGWMKPSGEVYRPEQTRLREVGPDGELVVVADEDEWKKKNPGKVLTIPDKQYVFADDVKPFRCDGPVCDKSEFYKWLVQSSKENN